MKKFGIVLSLLTLIVVAGCQGRTEYGECLGIQDDNLMKPNLEYRVSVRNTVLGVIFFQSIFAPVIWLAADFRCPVGYKTVEPTTIK